MFFISIPYQSFVCLTETAPILTLRPRTGPRGLEKGCCYESRQFSKVAEKAPRRLQSCAPQGSHLCHQQDQPALQVAPGLSSAVIKKRWMETSSAFSFGNLLDRSRVDASLRRHRRFDRQCIQFALAAAFDETRASMVERKNRFVRVIAIADVAVG